MYKAGFSKWRAYIPVYLYLEPELAGRLVRQLLFSSLPRPPPPAPPIVSRAVEESVEVEEFW